MATTTRERSVSRRGLLAGLTAGVVVGAALTVVLHAYGPGDMWAGFLGGGVLALAGLAVAAWRADRPDRSTPADRAFLHVGDERDGAILTRAAAVVGIAALPLTGLATVALAVGAEMLAVMGALLVTELAILVGAFAVVSRRS